MLLATSILFALIGLVLGGAGLWLVLLGGSFYYLLAGLVFLLTAFLLARRSEVALWLYAAFILASIVWAVWEVGFDWWQLGPRGGIIVLLGLWLLTPWIRRPLRAARDESKSGLSHWGLAAAVVVSAGVAAYSMIQDPQ